MTPNFTIGQTRSLHSPNWEFPQSKLRVYSKESQKADFRAFPSSFRGLNILRNILTELFVVQIVGRCDALELSDRVLRISNSFLTTVELQIRQNDVNVVIDGKK